MTAPALRAAPETETILVWRAKPSCGGPWCYDDSLTRLVGMIEDGATDGSAYQLEAVEMTREAWAMALDDFPGW